MKISIPNPCHENWNAMQPGDCGRFCNACQKTVMDFSRMSDMEFIHYFQHKNGAHCGRFTQHQLTLDIPAKPISIFSFLKMRKYAAAGLLALLGYSYKTAAQTKATTTTYQNQSEQHQQQSTSVKSNVEDTVVLKGFVKDKNGHPVNTAMVGLQKQGSIATLTEDDGSFELGISAADLKDTLVITTIGMNETKVSLNNIHPHEPLVVIVNDDEVFSTGIVIYGKKVTLWHKITNPVRRLFGKR